MPREMITQVFIDVSSVFNRLVSVFSRLPQLTLSSCRMIYLIKLQKTLKQTELKCMAVSTQDDIIYSNYGCGYAYENIIKPYEEKRQLPSSEKKYNSLWHLWSNHSSKNPQLMQIAQHAVKNTDPETSITLDYMDDGKD